MLTAALLTGCGWFGSDPKPPESALSSNATAEQQTPEESSWFGNLFTLEKDQTAQAQPPEAAAAPKSEPEPPTEPVARQSNWTLAGWIKGLWGSASVSVPMNELGGLDEIAEGNEADRKAKLQAFIAAKLQRIDRIYVQSFTGENLSEVRKGLFAALEQQSHYEVVEILPDDMESTAVLRIKVEDYNIWDSEEKFDLPKAELYAEEARKLLPRQIVRRNALVGVSLSLFDAQTGMPLVRGIYSQPFQQIYVGDDIAKMPKAPREMQRLTTILITKILNAFNAKETDLFGKNDLDLERGTSWGWFADEIHDPGDRRIMKGIKLAEVGEIEQAVGLFKLVLYAPDRTEPQEIYRSNRASAYYNLGILYQSQGDHLFAAKMFSQANRLVQKLKYAQAWGDNMHAWIDQKSDSQRNQEIEVVLPEPKDVQDPPKKRPDVIQILESNPNLLLNAQDLWPLEPSIKNAEPGQLNGTQRSSLDAPARHFDKQGYIDRGLDDQPPAPLPWRKPDPMSASESQQMPQNQPGGGLILPAN
ncbi:MAG: tetratricopeptide repeat protein [bacterium]|nr:tetratricopeptide repeat protein [bacterium]